MIPPLAPPNGMSTTAHFLDGDVRSVADAAFAGTAHQRVLHAIAGEYFQSPVIHFHRYVDRDFLVGMLQVLIEVLRETELLRGFLKAGFSGFVGIQFMFERQGSHYFVLLSERIG